jgi:HAMP domain-containing protein
MATAYCAAAAGATQALQDHAAVLRELLTRSELALALTVVLSIVLGWFIAGRVLRPLRTITAAARRISAASLAERLALSGPDDELKELGDTFDGLLGRLESSFAASASSSPTPPTSCAPRWPGSGSSARSPWQILAPPSTHSALRMNERLHAAPSRNSSSKRCSRWHEARQAWTH